MATFTVKESDKGKPCTVMDEDSNLVVKLKPPADIEHAEAVKKFLNENVKSIESLHRMRSVPIRRA